MLFKSSILIASILLLAPRYLEGVAAAGGQTEATCNSTFSWSFNSLNQSPCLVAADLGAVCSSTGTYDVPALAPGDVYTPSSADTPCECSTVVYSLIGVCALCQGQQPVTWTYFSENCSAVSPGFFPHNVPPGTAVPQWAYQDVTTSGVFNVTIAQQTGDTPESTPPAVSSTTSASSQGRSSGTALPATSAQASSSAGPATHKSSDTGAIAGGVVGGVAGIALIAALIFFLLRRRGQNRPNMVHNVNEKPFIDGYGSPPVDDTYMYGHHTPSVKPYDPSDPSTFPASPPVSLNTTAYNPSVYIPPSTPSAAMHTSYNGNPTPPPRSGGYTGVAEL